MIKITFNEMHDDDVIPACKALAASLPQSQKVVIHHKGRCVYYRNANNYEWYVGNEAWLKAWVAAH
jgi:hypothetical protein